MIYTQLNTEYKYRHIASAIYQREMEYFHYNFDLINFEHLVANLLPSTYQDDIKKRIKETADQMANVRLIIAALHSQIDDEAAYAEAVSYTTQKREKEEAEK